MKKIIAILFLSFSIIVHAQQRLTLTDAINIALQNSIGVHIARNNIQIAGLNNSYGMAGGMPSVVGSISQTEQANNINQQFTDASRNAQRNNVVNNNSQASLGGSILLFNGGRIVNAKARLGIVERQSEQLLLSRTMLLAANVMLRYYDIIRQQSYGATLEKSIQVSQRKLDIVKAQQSAGFANNANLFQAQVDLNNQSLTLQTQQLIIAQGKTDLLTLLTLNPDSAIIIADTIIVDQAMSLGVLLKAVEQNPDIVTASQQIDIDKHIQREIGAQRYPSLSLNGGYSLARSQYTAGPTLLNQQVGPYIGLGLNIPVFNGGIFQRQYKIAGVNVNNDELAKDSLRLNYKSGIIRNWESYQSNLRQLITACENLTVATKLLDLVLQQFQVRQNTILDVENAQQSYENAANQLINVEYSAKASEIQLKRLANRLDL
jgi:outer membrane protein